MNAIEENFLGKTPINYVGGGLRDSKGHLLPYDDSKTFFQLASGQGNTFKCGYTFTLLNYQTELKEFEELLRT